MDKVKKQLLEVKNRQAETKTPPKIRPHFENNQQGNNSPAAQTPTLTTSKQTSAHSCISNSLPFTKQKTLLEKSRSEVAGKMRQNHKPQITSEWWWLAVDFFAFGGDGRKQSLVCRHT